MYQTSKADPCMETQDNGRERACGSCGASIDAGARFCAFCGTEMHPASSSDASPRASAGLCPNCGEPKPSSETKYCNSCGHQYFMEIELPLPETSDASTGSHPKIQDATAGPARSVDRQTAGFLAIFLGTVGVHKFYMGHVTAGLLCCFFCWTFIPTIIGIIEGIKFFSMTEEEFQKGGKRQA